MFPIIGEPVGRKSGFIRTFNEFFAGLQLPFPIAHGVGLCSQAFNIPKMKKKVKIKISMKSLYFLLKKKLELKETVLSICFNSGIFGITCLKLLENQKD